MEILFNNNILDKIEKIANIYPDAFQVILTRPEWEQFLSELEQKNTISDKNTHLTKDYFEYKGLGIEKIR